MNGVTHELLVSLVDEGKAAGFETVCGDYDDGDNGSLARDRVTCPECKRGLPKRCPECNREMNGLDREEDGAARWHCDYCSAIWTQVLDLGKEFGKQQQTG